MADTFKIKTIEPYESVPYIPFGEYELESRHGAQFFSNVKQLAVGYGAQVFRVDRDGLWLGAEDFASAPFSVDMQGNVSLTSITTLTGFTNADLTSVALPTNGIRVDANGIYGRDSGVTTFSLDTGGNAYFSGEIEGSIITGGTVRTSSSGARVQLLEATNTLQILDSSGVVRAESYSNGWEFNNSAGSTRGRIFIENTFGNLQLQSTSADVFIAAASDITFATGNGSISMYIDETSKDLVLTSGDIVLGNTTIQGGGSWTLTLPSTNGSSGEFLQTDGAGNTSWASVSSGANTALSNLTTTSINQDLNPGSSVLDIGQSGNPWDRLYVDDIYLTNGDGTIRYNGNVAWDFYASHIRLGSVYSDLSPASFLGANLGDTFRWNAFFCDSIDCLGTVDANSLRFSAGEDITGNGNVIEYDADLDHIFYINSVLTAIIDDNIFTEGDLLANGSKPFIIPHPDGSGRLLRYTAQESPEVLLRHRGIATTDATGNVMVEFPEHFRLVTEDTGDVTVNLTAVGDHRVYLDGVPSNGLMHVASSEPNVTFHFEVVAVRAGYKDQPVELEEGDGTGWVEKMRSIPEKNAAIKARKAAMPKRRVEATASGG